MSWPECANWEGRLVYWLKGPAGIGKINDPKNHRRAHKAILGPSFFFSRSERALENPRLVLPTLLTRPIGQCIQVRY
jgi:hypothetical protein